MDHKKKLSEGPALGIGPFPTWSDLFPYVVKKMKSRYKL